MKCSTLIVRRSSWILSHWLLGIVVSLALGSVPVRATYALDPVATNLPGTITLHDDMLTVRVKAVPLQQVMEEVSRLSGAQIRWLSQDGEEPVSAEFPALPFSEALRRILGERNFLLFYTSPRGETKLTQIWISSGGQAGRQPVLTRQPVPQGKTTQVTEGPDEETAQALEVVIQTALNDEDLSSRLGAIEYLGHYAQEDPRVKAILSQLAQSDNNPQVQDVASAMLEGME